MKKHHLLSLTILLLLAIPVASFAEVCIDGIYYNLDSSTKEAAVTYDNNPEVTVNAYRTTYKGNIIIPATIKYDGTTYNVTSIETFAFSGNEELLTIKFPTSITPFSN